MKRAVSVVLAGALFLVGFAVSGESAEKGKELFEGKCALCHPLSRALSQSKDREGWTKTVKRMKEANGCKITDAEAEEIVGYLVSVRGPAAGK